MTHAQRQALVERLGEALYYGLSDAALEALLRDVLALLRADEAEPPATPAPSRPAGGAAKPTTEELLEAADMCEARGWIPSASALRALAFSERKD
jgi:hypothetical protein